MQKTILITGATDGIGLETAKMLISQKHHVLLHGRNPAKLEAVKKQLSSDRDIEIYVGDLSLMSNVENLAKAVKKKHSKLDVLINNAGVYNAANPITQNGLDIRFAVNAIAPYLLTQRLLPLLDTSGRVINLSSAAQSTVNLEALTGKVKLTDGAAYAQSKLALTIWSRSLGLSLKDRGPMIVAINPGSLLGSKMVKQAYGVKGGDLSIGAEILTRAALTDEFKTASGKYFDNDVGRFASPHADALDTEKSQEVITVIEKILARNTG
ncbi:MAG: SDR family NAD(P)-dependent oxidoreductase [Cyanobacteria bacterium P01_F01_bin.143]